jgi:hypothetical protein
MSEGYRPDPYDAPSPRERHSEHYANIPLYLLLTLVTFFLFNLYWNYRQMQACNDLLERNEFGFLSWLVLVIVTCGIYHLFYQYRMGAAINEIQERFDRPVTDGLPVLSVVAAILGFGIVADCIHQYEINLIVTR